MQNFIKTIINAVQSWTKKEIKNSTADWNQNDASTVDYVKNRTHWSDGLVEEVVLKQQTVGPSDTVDCEIIVGQTYEVTWDNKVYHCVAWGDSSVIGLGFGEFMDIGEGETVPFLIYNNKIHCASGTTHTISITTTVENIHKLDSKYLDLPTNLATTDDVQEALDVANNAQSAADTAQNTANSKMDATNPVGTGSFSMNRKSGTTVGNYSHAEGYKTTASGPYSHAEGYNTTVSSANGHAEGAATKAQGESAHAEGRGTIASGVCSHAEGCYTKALGSNSHVSGKFNSSDNSYIEKIISASNGANGGDFKNVEFGYLVTSVVKDVLNGYYIIEYESSKTTMINVEIGGIYTKSIETLSDGTVITYSLLKIESKTTKASSITVSYDESKIMPDKYVHIVGNGTSDTNRSNAHTLDWAGNAWFQGEVYIGGSGQDDEAAVKLATINDIQSYVDNAILGGAW